MKRVRLDRAHRPHVGRSSTGQRQATCRSCSRLIATLWDPPSLVAQCIGLANPKAVNGKVAVRVRSFARKPLRLDSSSPTPITPLSHVTDRCGAAKTPERG